MLSAEEALLLRWVRSQYMIKTPQIERVYAFVENLLFSNATGGMIVGAPRTGKTYALKYVASVLQDIVGEVPCIEVDVRRESRASDDKFCQLILESARHEHAAAGRAADKRFRLSECLHELALRSDCGTVVLIFDEAHLLSDEHLEWMLNITNEVQRRGSWVLCVLVGQPELDDRRAALAAGGFLQLIGRFMVDRLEFKGLRSKAEVHACLQQYSKLKYPSDADDPLVQRLLPKANKGTWKLENDSELVWESFGKQWELGGNATRLEIPMKYFCSYVNQYLLAHLRCDEGIADIDLHKKAMDGSRFQAFSQVAKQVR